MSKFAAVLYFNRVSSEIFPIYALHLRIFNLTDKASNALYECSDIFKLLKTR